MLRCHNVFLGLLLFLVLYLLALKPRDSSLSARLYHPEDDPFLYTEVTPATPPPPPFSSSRVANLRFDPPRIFKGSKTWLSGEWTSLQGGGDTLRVALVGVDEGDPERHLLCDKHHADRLPKSHGQFPLVLELTQQKNSKAWGAWLGEDVSRVGKFLLCLYTEDPKDMIGWKPYGQEFAVAGERKKHMGGVDVSRGRYVNTRMILEINWPEHIGLHLITSLYNSSIPGQLNEFYSSLRASLSNPYIAEIHFLQPQDDYTLFSDAILRHKKFSYIVVGRPLTYAMMWEYGRRYLTGRRILLAPLDVHHDETLRHLQLLPSSVFDTTVYTLMPNDSSTTDFSAIILAPSFLGSAQDHLKPLPQPNELSPPPTRDPQLLTDKIDFSLGTQEASARFLRELRNWFPEVVVRDPAPLVRSWSRAGAGDKVKVVAVPGLVEEGFWGNDYKRRKAEILRREMEGKKSWWSW